MYITVRRYKADSEKADEIMDKVNTGFAPMIKQEAGFVKYYAFKSPGGIVTSISIFEDETQAEASARASAHWVCQNIGHLIPQAPDVTGGEVTVEG